MEYNASTTLNISEQATEQAQDVFIFPASFAQQRLWLLNQLEPESTAYQIPLALRLRGPLRIDLLRESFQLLVQRHEVFRTSFALQDGELVQRVAASLNVSLPMLDLRDLPQDRRHDCAWERASQLAAQPFDLRQPPLLRLLLLRLHDEEHLLVFVVHHIITDGWSQGLLLHELGQTYSSLLRGQRLSSESGRLQYADFAVWQRRFLQGPRLAALRQYWQQHLRDAPTVLDLPTDYPRPAALSSRGASVHGAIPPDLLQAVRAWSKQRDATLFMGMLSSLALLLSRLSGQRELLIGTVVAGRPRRSLESVLGFFANTLPLRLDLDGALTPNTLLQRVRSEVLAASEHQDLPFDQIVELLQPARDLSRPVLVQTVLVLDNTPEQPIEMSGLQMEILEVPTAATRFDLTLSAVQDSDHLLLHLEYATDLYEQETMQRLLRRYTWILGQFAAHPDTPITDLNWFDPEERAEVVQLWNETASPHLVQQNVTRLIEEQARCQPDRVALIENARRLSYAQLEQQASRLAHHLRRLGVGPDTLVGVCLPRRLELVVALLAVWKAGGAYLPLDPSYPAERLEYMLSESEARVVLTCGEVRGQVQGWGGRVLLVEEVGELIDEAGGEGEEEEERERGEQLAYVIYTSGSTGRPKGVQITRDSIDHFIAYMLQELALQREDVCVAVTTFAFDIAALELFCPLAAGACVVMASSEEATSGEELAALIEHVDATVMQATPVTWQMLVKAGWQGSRRLRALCGGEALSQELAEELLQRVASLRNMYGPTETTVWSVLHHVVRVDGPLPIGRPIAHTQCYVLDASMQPVPAGVVGELYIGGFGVARGYWRQGGLTAERFVPDPFSQKEGARLYRTGDRARYRNDGTLEFLGRLDYQVKLHGHRIELGEIESVLSRLEGVQAAVALVREDTPGEKRLVAYVVGSREALPTQEEMRDALWKRLPAYMVPTHIVVLDTLPLTPNGKVNRRALPAPDGLRPELNVAYVPPRTPIEGTLVQIWKDILHLKEVGIHDNFFDLGGDSMQCMQIVTRAHAAGLPISSKQIFQAQTIAGLAALEESRGASQAKVGQAAEQPLLTTSAFPLLELDQHELAKVAGLLGEQE